MFLRELAELRFRLVADHECAAEVIIGYRRARLQPPAAVYAAYARHIDDHPECRNYAMDQEAILACILGQP